MQAGANVIDTGTLVKRLIKTERLLKILFAVTQLDARLLPPVQIGHQYAVAFLGEEVGNVAHCLIDPEYFLAKHHSGAASTDCSGQVGLELSSIVRIDADIATVHLRVSNIV